MDAGATGDVDVSEICIQDNIQMKPDYGQNWMQGPRVMSISVKSASKMIYRLNSSLGRIELPHGSEQIEVHTSIRVGKVDASERACQYHTCVSIRVLTPASMVVAGSRGRCPP
jgi:hypothetical protein